MFIHDISLKHNPETTATNLFQASLLRSVVGEFNFSLWAQLWFTGSAFDRLKVRKFLKAYLHPKLTA